MSNTFKDFHGFCFCGLALHKDLCGNLFCVKHKHNIDKKEIKIKRGRFSGKSKSVNAFNEYK